MLFGTRAKYPTRVLDFSSKGRALKGPSRGCGEAIHSGEDRRLSGGTHSTRILERGEKENQRS